MSAAATSAASACRPSLVSGSSSTERRTAGMAGQRQHSAAGPVRRRIHASSGPTWHRCCAQPLGRLRVRRAGGRRQRSSGEPSGGRRPSGWFPR
jgi:hypothetical protein